MFIAFDDALNFLFDPFLNFVALTSFRFSLEVLVRYLRARKRPVFSNREALDQWQHQKVVRHLQRLLPKSPWLRERFGSLPIERWRELPVVGKSEMMQHFDDLNTVGITANRAFDVAIKAESSRDFSSTIGDITIGLSSGTSGGRGLFLASPQERAAWAANALARLLPSPIWKGHRIALFLRAGSNLYSSVNSRAIQFSWFDLFQPMESHFARLATFNPSMLIAPPSVLRILGDALASDDLRISPVKVVSAAETLDALDRSLLTTQFRQPIHEIYQATEGFLATTDHDTVLRLHEDLLVIEPEWLDAARTRFVPIITDFHRTSQPMIRHRLDDVLHVHEQYGHTPYRGLASIDGRCDDLLRVGRQTIFPDFISRALITADPHLTDFRVTQVSENHWQVAVKPTANEHALLNRLRQLITDLTHNPCTVNLELVPFPTGESHAQKRRRIQRLIPQDHGN